MIVRHNYATPAQALNRFSGSSEWFLFDKYDRVEMRGFDAFGAVDTAIAALGVITKVKLAYGAGGLLLKIFPVDFEDLVAKAAPAVDLLLPGMLTSPSKGAISKTYRDLGALIDDWASRKYRWAQAGKRDDGTAYSWKQWGELGKVYLDSVVYTAGLPIGDGYFANAAQAIKEFIESLIKFFQPTEWPTWAKVAAGLAGAVAVAYVINTVRGPLR
jgi:hypothetical protein